MEVTARNSSRATKTKIYFKQFNISQSPPNHQFDIKNNNNKKQKTKKKKKKREKLRAVVTKFQVLFFSDTFSQQPNRIYKYI